MNPLQEKFNEIADYCQKLEDENFDNYKFFQPASMTDIENWEHQHSMKLPEGYKNWLLLSNGFSCSAEDFLPLEHICACPAPEYTEYHIIGHYGGDGSMLVTDRDGTLYKLDDSYGLLETTFEKFLDQWVIMWLKNDMMEAGLL